MSSFIFLKGTAEFDLTLKGSPESVTKTAGEYFVMECKVLREGQPVGEYYWKVDEKRVIYDDRVYINEAGKGFLCFVIFSISKRKIIVKILSK